MIRTMVVDDEGLARQQLIRMLAEESDIEMIAEAANGIEALEKIGELRPDVCFLDIEMPGLNGVEVAANLSDPPLLVFATAYDEYAVRAFEANALDYLLKPIQPERVRQCVARIRAALDHHDGRGERLKTLLASTPMKKLAVRKGRRIVVLSLKEITHASIEDKLVFVHTDKDRFLTDRTIGEIEESLGGSGFFRISRGEVVNLEHVRELIPWFSGSWKVKLANGVELDVSRERTRQLKELMGI